MIWRIILLWLLVASTTNHSFAMTRRLTTTTMLVSNGAPSVVPPQTISSYYDPQVRFLELGVLLTAAPEQEFLQPGTSPMIQTIWKFYGPDLDGKYGGLNGTGGFEGVSPYLNSFNPVISDARGNVLAEVTNGVAAWTLARPTGYGAVPGYRPVAYGNGVDFAMSTAWRGREVDPTGYYHLGLRDYDPVSGQWLSYDPSWNAGDPNGQSFCGGDPVNQFDPTGKCANNSVANEQLTFYPNANLGPWMSSSTDTTPNPQPTIDWSRPVPYTYSNPDDVAFENNLRALVQAAYTGVQITATVIPFVLSDGTTAVAEGALEEETAVTTDTLVTGSTERTVGGSTEIPANPAATPTATPAPTPPASAAPVTSPAPPASFLAAEGTQPLALGLTDAGLSDFAQARGATIATGENWQTTVLDALNDPNTTVHFNLDQVDVWQGVQRAASGQGGPTDWELLQIQQNPQSWNTLQFWKGGQPAPNPFK